MNKLFFVFALLLGFTAAGFAQTGAAPTYHKQIFKLKEGTNNARLDLNMGTIKIVVRDRKVISAVVTRPSGRQFPIKLNTDPTGFTNCDCPYDPNGRFAGIVDGFIVCGYDCGTIPPPSDPGKPIEIPDFPLAWCTSNCPDWE